MLKRKINLKFDCKESIHHKFNLDISKKYIKNSKILDIGCWTGQFEKIASRYSKNITGIDPNKKAINFAKKNIPDLTFKTGTALKLNFKDNSFDVVTFFEVLEHLPKNSELIAFKEINRVLKPNGYFIMSTPNNNLLSIILDPAFFLIKHRHYSFGELKRKLKLCKFKIVNKYYTGGLVKLIISNINLINKHVFNKKQLTMPKTIKDIVYNEYYEGGFSNIHIIAKKI